MSESRLNAQDPLRRGAAGSGGYPVPGGDPAVEENAVPWRLWLGIVLARKWILLGVAATVFAAAAVYTYRLPPVYSAGARLLIERDTPKVLDVEEILAATDGWENDYYNTQVQLIASRRIAERVFKDLGLWASPEFEGMSDPIPAFLGHVSVKPVRNSRLVDVTVTHGEPAKAAAWASALVKAYIDDAVERRAGLGREALAQLRAEEEEMRGRLDAKEQAIQSFCEAKGLVSLNERQTLLEQRLGDLASQATAAAKQRQDLEATQEKIATLLAKGSWTALFSLPQVQESEVLRKIRVEQVQLLQEQRELAKTYKDRHPRLAAVQSRLDSLEESLREEAERVAEGLRGTFEEAKGRELKAAAALEAAKAEKVQFDRDRIELARLEREAEATRSLFQNILKRIQETSVSSQLELTNISVADRPVTPEAPAGPNRRMHLMLGLMAGIALGLAAAFLVEQLDPTIDAPDEAERVIGAPLLGVVPHIGDDAKRYGRETGTGERDAPEGGRPGPASAGLAGTGSRIMKAIGLGGNGNGNGGGEPPELVCHLDMKSRASEAFRSIRTAIQFAGRERGGREIKSFAVVSVAPREGKTVAAINLAVAMSQVGHRVLVVDADMRRPRVHEALGLPATGPGLSDVLKGGAALDDVVQETKVKGLWVITAGPIPPNPSELLSSPRLAELVHEAEERFDRVLFDSPPVGAVTDACVLAPELDAVVHVIGFGRASRQEVREGKRQLTALGAKYLGAVFNDVPLNTRWYGKLYGHQYPYAYYEKYAGYYK